MPCVWDPRGEVGGVRCCCCAAVVSGRIWAGPQADCGGTIPFTHCEHPRPAPSSHERGVCHNTQKIPFAKSSRMPGRNAGRAGLSVVRCGAAGLVAPLGVGAKPIRSVLGRVWPKSASPYDAGLSCKSMNVVVKKSHNSKVRFTFQPLRASCGTPPAPAPLARCLLPRVSADDTPPRRAPP